MKHNCMLTIAFGLDHLVDASTYGRQCPWDIEGRPSNIAWPFCGVAYGTAGARRTALGVRIMCCRVVSGRHARNPHEGRQPLREIAKSTAASSSSGHLGAGALGGFTSYSGARTVEPATGPAPGRRTRTWTRHAAKSPNRSARLREDDGHSKVRSWQRKLSRATPALKLDGSR